ncbi:MAG: hypothetical protein WA964_20825 [Ilumatobacter sp.]|uniref:hypothetical protein n=1 Tax=Ilumatobacter sp. TaxID=1967498 RepID=UPI003C73FA43
MARLAFTHPSRQRLLGWLDATDESSRITEHVEQCDRCASRIEELAEQSDRLETFETSSLGEALRAVYEPPEGINGRVMEKIQQRRLVDREMNVLMGLFAIPKDAVTLLLPSDPDEETPHVVRDDREE